METKFCLRMIKETYIDAENRNEAEQIAEILSQRESNEKVFGRLVTIYTEVEEVSNN
jgi:hypothetical protein